jgi:hypothetical protein
VTDGQSAYPSWCRAPLWDPRPDFIFSFLLLENYFTLRLGAPFLTRGRVCILYCNLSVVRVEDISWPYITVSSEPLTTRRDYGGNILTRLHAEKLPGKSKSKSKLFCDWQSVNQYVLVSSPLWDLWPDAAFLWKVGIWMLLSCILLGALSDERSGLSFVSLSQ